MKRLIDLYPRLWRERYGAELEEFVARRPGLRAAVDLVRGAFDAHLHPELVTHRFSAMTLGGIDADDMVFVPNRGFRSVHALGTRANVIVEKDGRRLIAVIGPDRDGVSLAVQVTGIVMEVGPNGRRFEDPVRIHDDHGRDISKPRPRWQVGGFLRPVRDGTVTLGYTTMLEPLARDVRTVVLELEGAAGEWKVDLPVEPEGFVGAPAHATDASDTKHGVTIAARLVARSDTETAIELEAWFDPPEQVDDPRPARRWISGLSNSGHPMRQRLILRDDAGQDHRELGQFIVERAARKYREAVTFPALDVASVVLEIPDVWTKETMDQSVTVPVPGETDIQIAGCEARIVVGRDGEHSDHVRVDFTPRDPDAQRQLLYLESMVIPGGDPRGTLGMSIVQCDGQQPYITLPDPKARVREVTLRSPVVLIRGPWTLPIPLGPA